jgi:protein-disulfide isomerase
VKRIQKHFGKRLKFVFRNFPLNEAHPHAESAAETAEFAGAHGKFWEMHDLLFENQEHLGATLYLKLAADLKLQPQDLRQAIEKRDYAAHVKSDFTGGVRSGVNGTPAFFINGERHDLPFDYEDLLGEIESKLALT